MFYVVLGGGFTLHAAIFVSLHPTDIQSQKFWGLVSLVQVSRIEMSDLVLKLLTFQRECQFSTHCGLLHWGLIFGETTSLLLLLSQMILLSFVVDELFSWFTGLFQRELFHM